MSKVISCKIHFLWFAIVICHFYKHFQINCDTWKGIISGVKFRSKFWQLRRRPVVIFSKWLPVGTFLALLNLAWEISPRNHHFLIANMVIPSKWILDHIFLYLQITLMISNFCLEILITLIIHLYYLLTLCKFIIPK